MNAITMHESCFFLLTLFFNKRRRRDFFPSGPDKGPSTSNPEYDKSQTVYFPPHNSLANSAESVFVIDNYSGGHFD